MRALEFTAELTPRVVDAPVPDPAPGEVLVRVTSAGVCGSDVTALKRAHPFRKTLTGSTVYTAADFAEAARVLERSWRDLVGLVTDGGGLEGVVTYLDDALAARTSDVVKLRCARTAGPSSRTPGVARRRSSDDHGSHHGRRPRGAAALGRALRHRRLRRVRRGRDPVGRRARDLRVRRLPAADVGDGLPHPRDGDLRGVARTRARRRHRHGARAAVPGQRGQVGLPDEFLAAGALPTLHERYGLSTDALVARIKEELS